MSGKESGFTLIELMVVVAIIALLAAIAYPSYTDHVRKTRYAQAKEGAMQVSTALERYVSQRVEYPSDLSAAIATASLPYADILDYGYVAKTTDTTSSLKKGYTLTVKEKSSNFGLWVMVNGYGPSGGTHCGCDGKVCTVDTAVALSATDTTCSSPTVAF